MIAEAGRWFLSIAFISSVFTMVLYAYASIKHDKKAEQISNWLWGLKGILVTAASAALIYLIMTHQFQYFYVWNYTSLDLEPQYLFSAFYGGQEGSFLLWVFFAFLVGLGLIKWTRKPYRGPVMFVMAMTQFFLLSMILGWDFGVAKIGASPFRTIAQEMPNAPFLQANPGFVPQDGTGLNDLLKSPWMMIHPPIIFLGFSMMTVPFAFAVASLWTKTYHEWIRPALPWTLAANLCLLTAIFLGGYWAYETLSFGGYWAWDPVENASLVPWLIGTAGIHAMIIQRKSKRAHKASIFFALLAYVSVIYQTFLTRSGVLADQSVHSFVDLGLYNQLLAFILIVTFMGIGFYLYRYKELPSPEKESKFLSREFMTFTGAMLLFILGIVIILGTSSPILGKLFVDNPTPPDIQFYNDWSMPIAIIMAITTVIGQYLFWEKHTWESLAGELITPLLVTSTISVISIVLGNVTSLYYMIYIFAGWFTVIGNGTVLIRLLRKNPKLVGGTLTHIGFGLLLLGIISSSVYTTPMLDKRTEDYNLRVEQGDVIDEEGFPITQKVEMFELTINQPKLISDKYMVTYEGYELSDSPRPGQQNYRLKFEPIEGGNPFYLSPEVYPMLTSSGPNSVEWSVDPHVRTGWFNDIYLYVAGSQYVEKRNEAVEQNSQNQPMIPVGDAQSEDQQAEEDVQTIELSQGETTTAGPFQFTFQNFVPASEESLPENTQIGIRSLIRIEHEPSGRAFEAEPLFAVYTEDDRSYTYSPPIDIQEWGMSVLFTSVHPETDSIELSVYGLDENFEEDWVLVVAEQKPFVSIVWMGTFMLMAGFSVSIFRHWAREKNTV
ncbi:heme lyase CcmF/NrfE family subunit [Rhodohalobacter sp. 614A]|uniref:heme lyase CcmF/NrfE family subunit n=1 Tax=Rhodohalobacter sp. 614A TaxID=2908649 RepID=UPI001F48028C|nr:cytochrome c biogenesis protein CcsA [Rhodohalobacter sp. 614A]